MKKETPVDHGEIICFSIYCGPEADFGDGKSCVWVDVLDGGGKEILNEFAPFFEDPAIKKVNYLFWLRYLDLHIFLNSISVNYLALQAQYFRPKVLNAMLTSRL